MNEYTAEDFKNANIAVRGTLHAARRAEPDTTLPWVYGDNEWDDDKGMVENGWRPIVEADHPTRPLAGYRAQVKELREKVRDLERDPLTLDTLREAWENAIGSTTVHVGDTIIQRDTGGESFSVYVTDRGHPRATVDVRVLKRAPQPEPWQALADELDTYGIDVSRSLAQELHRAGWRKTGGDET